MKKFFLLDIILILCVTSAFSQIEYYEHPDNVRDTTKSGRKYFFGVSAILNFGSITYVELSPKLVYPLTNWYSLGGAFDAVFVNINGFKDFMYGYSIFDQIYIYKFMIFQTEAKILNRTNFYTNERIWNTALYAGIGYKQRLGNHFYATYVLLWDFLYNEWSFYNNPTFRISFYF